MKDKNNAIRWGLTVFVTVAAILLFYDTLFGRRVLLNITRQFLRALQPVIIGGLLAYLLAPAIDFIEDALFSGRLKKAREGGKLISRGARAVSLVLVWVMIGLLLYLLGHVLLPQLQCGDVLQHCQRMGGTPAGEQSGVGGMGGRPDGHIL